jgi:hypothetical protein
VVESDGWPGVVGHPDRVLAAHPGGPGGQAGAGFDAIRRDVDVGKKTKAIRRTKTQFFTDECPTCSGKGRVPCGNLSGWYLHYRYQDGHETSGPFTREEAVRRYRGHSDRSSMVTLVGPDGRIYAEG